ncbi:NAD(P)-dependent alcohol dehydrogenase [Frigidibacter sp. ROC022]|uniref:NAD(P)-dependent alcohol dehydrogenase n=1 Tax=Frigidibacter sp. ROC022 TaxID=2971796 RepID=UPI00215B45C1|nr:NAD(P)-dependent alcohol dehydrogenase [Frigidibacter sp. ROC022]MCR8725343.1 NAD(P)-dependent alcohol dehydrogenase [Frigidibacter sp. ROC022]
MRALVLERVGQLSLRDIALDQSLGPDDVRIAVHTVGICGSDVHYYTHGRIGPFVVEAPMVLGHEAAGVVTEVGAGVTSLAPGDRVCMEPGVPDPHSRAARLGIYNVDPAVTFWATPPVHGCLTGSVTHPAAYTYRLPDSVSFAEGAMVEPFAIGMQAAARARIAPGDVALVIGAGPIGYMVALAALAGGCARVYLSDVKPEKLEAVQHYPGLIAPPGDATARVMDETAGWGADLVFECSGHPSAFGSVFSAARPGGAVVFVGMPVEPVPLDIVAAQARELRMETVFRYANVYDRALALIGAGKVDLKPLITETFAFADSVAAFERAAEGRPRDIKLQIRVG